MVLQVVPALVKLKKMTLTDSTGQPVPIYAERYQPLVREGSSEYDKKDEFNTFDSSTLRGLLKDHLEEDPATRYEIAKNEFNRALHNARVCSTRYLCCTSPPSDVVIRFGRDHIQTGWIYEMGCVCH